jgi:AcrR family transcriptional regulator
MKSRRKEKALETRRRVLKAAYRLFCAHGYAATTMDAIAKEAEVAVQTLYFTFHTKGAILSETVGASILGFDRWDPRAEPAVTKDPRKAFEEFHGWFPAFRKATTSAQALTVFVDASMGILARVSPLVGVVTAAAASDPDVRAMSELGEQRRVEGYRLVVELLARRGGLRRGVSVSRGTDIVLAILSGETYQHLAHRRRWSEASCRKWFLDVLGQQLLATP